MIAPFLTDRKEFLKSVVKPLQDKVETIYVVPGSDAEDYVARRSPHKTTKRVSNGLVGQRTIRAFLRGMKLVFQRVNVTILEIFRTRTAKISVQIREFASFGRR